MSYYYQKRAPFFDENGYPIRYYNTTPSIDGFKNMSSADYAEGVLECEVLANGKILFDSNFPDIPLTYVNDDGLETVMRLPTARFACRDYFKSGLRSQSQLIIPTDCYPAIGGMNSGFSRWQTGNFWDSVPGTYYRDTYSLEEKTTSLLRRTWFSALGGAQKSDLDVAMTLFGLKDSLVLLLDGLNRLVRAYRYLKRGQLIKVAEILLIPQTKRPKHLFNASTPFDASVGSFWLELMFGWKQLISDLEASWAIYNEEVRLADYIVTSTGRASHSEGLRHEHSATQYDQTKTSALVINGSTTFQWRMDDIVKRYLAELGFTNPLYILWDTIPFSYVVDMLVLPIGSMLKTLSAEDGLQRISVSQSVKYSIDYANVVHLMPEHNTVGTYERHARNATHYSDSGSIVHRDGPQPLFFEDVTSRLSAVMDSAFSSDLSLSKLMTTWSTYSVVKSN